MATSQRRRASDKTADKSPAASTETQAAPQGFTQAGEPLASVTLEMIAAATAAGSFLYLSPAVREQFGASVETNESMMMNDYVAARSAENVVQSTSSATNQTAEPNMTATQTQTAPATKTNPTFEIEENFAMPTAKRPGNGNTKYPFDALNEGAAFFVPGGSVKSLASTVASANARYAEVVKHPDGTPVMRTNRKGKPVEQTKQLRQFQVRAGEKNGVAGAYVGRLKLSA
jgi:hypothetical protein